MRAARARLHSLNCRNNGSGAGPASVVGVRLRRLHVPEDLSLTRLLGRLDSFPAARFCQLSRQTGFLGWEVTPSPSRVASKNGGL
jgi:hypothetical protein